MSPLILIHIPIIIALVWCAVRIYNRGGKHDAHLVAACGIIIVINSIIRHFVFEGYEPSYSVTIAQQILSALIIPFAYLYFAMQVNVKLVNECSITLFALTSLLLFPNINIVTATDPTTLPLDVILPTTVPDASPSCISWQGSAALLHEMTACRTLNIITDTSIMQYTIADLIMAIQAAVTMIRIAPLFRKLRSYGLQPSRDVKIFTAWWTATALFAVFSSAFSDTNHTDKGINIFCHFAFMVLMVGICILMGRGINFQPVPASSTKHADTTDTFADKSKDMAQQLMTMINERHIHLQQGFAVDTAIDELHTNRTYFYRMLKDEFGCTFSELMNRERVKEIKHLLTTTDDSISAIADACGFKNTSYMIKVFKQLEGRTPSEWKKQNTIQQS